MQQPTLFQKILSTGFGVGFCPVAPGTMGALLATVVWLVIFVYVPYPISLIFTILLLLLLTYFGAKASGAVEAIWGRDPSRVVVDEMVGVLFPLALIIPSDAWYWYAIASFALFRFFDIFKPLGIRRMEKYPSGVGIMADDILAGVYSAIIILAAQWFFG